MVHPDAQKIGVIKPDHRPYVRLVTNDYPPASLPRLVTNLYDPATQTDSLSGFESDFGDQESSPASFESFGDLGQKAKRTKNAQYAFRPNFIPF